jgi:two-component system sensor histidine kinase PilS (NtrC family)
VNPVLRLILLFGVLLVAILLVHQEVLIQAAEYIISAPLPPETATAEWRRAGDGTRLLLQLFAAGALIVLLTRSLRVIQGHENRPTTSLEAIQPLTAVLTDLREREQVQRREKRAAVAEMTEMRAIHTTILEGVSTGVLTVDRQGRLATCNAAAAAILDWDGPPPVGEPVETLFRGCLPPHLTGAGTTARRTEFTWRPPGLPPRHLGLSLSPIQTPAGRLNAVLFTDLTEMKRLKRAVELRRHLAQLGEVSAGIAHEFRNNMGAVMGYARLVVKDTPEGSPARDVVEAMMSELTGMEHLISDLLAFSRKEELHFAPVPVERLVRQAAEVGSADFDLEVVPVVAPDLPPLRADESRLRQSLINLVRNACEAAGAAGAPRVVVTAGPEKEESAPGTAEWVHVTVADNGPGIDPAMRPKVFLPFFTTKESGTGMGLAHVHKTVTAHGGEVNLLETPSGGAVFRLRLPTVRRPAAAPGTPSESPSDDGKEVA